MRCAIAAGAPAYSHPITGIAGCCARAANGHAAAEPAIALMKSRRLMQPSAEPQNHANFKLKGYHIYDALYRH